MTVYGFAPGATVRVIVGTTIVGERLAPSGVDELTFDVEPVLGRRLMSGDIVRAAQFETGPVVESDPVEVRDSTLDYPDGLPVPVMHPLPLRECGQAVGASAIVAGATVRFYRGPTLIDTSEATSSEHRIVLNLPSQGGDLYYAQQELCANLSAVSEPAGVLPPPSSSLPSPIVVGSLSAYVGQTSIPLNSTFFGASVSFAVNGAHRWTLPSLAAYGETWSFPLPTAAAGDTLQIAQYFCEPEAEPLEVPVRGCDELRGPQMQPPQVGDEFIELDVVTPGARVRVYADGVEIGDGSGRRIRVRPLLLGEEIVVTQSLGECTSRWAHRMAAECRAVRRVRRLTPGGIYTGWGRYEVGAADYDFGPLTINGFTTDVRATVRYPIDPIDGSLVQYGPPLPVVFVMHGNMPNYVDPGAVCADNGNCHPALPSGATPLEDHHLGFVSLLEALARDGVIAISIDASDLNCLGLDPLDQTGADLWREHLSYWKDLNTGTAGVDPFGGAMLGRVDLRRTTLVGHSRGARRIINVVQDNTDPAIVFRAAIMLAPPDHVTVPMPPLKSVPLLLIRGSRDAEHHSFTFYDEAEVPMRAQMYLEGGTHTGFSDMAATYCESDQTLSGLMGAYMAPEQQQDMLREWSWRWVRLHMLGGGLDDRAVFTGDGAVRLLHNHRVSVTFSESADLTLDNFEDRNAMTSLYTPVAVSGFETVVEDVLYQSTADDYDLWHDTSGLYVGYAAGGSVNHTTFPLIDTSEYRFLSFRAGRAYDASSDLELLVAINGAVGDTVPSTDVVRIPEQPYASLPASAMTTTVRIPLQCLSAYNAEASGPLSSTYIEAASEGAFMLDDLALQH